MLNLHRNPLNVFFFLYFQVNQLQPEQLHEADNLPPLFFFFTLSAAMMSAQLDN